MPAPLRFLHASVIAAILCIGPDVVRAATYNLAKDYSGSSFFDEWDFYGHWDNLTLGDVNWLDRTNATNQKLAFVNSEGNAILKVDNVTDVLWPNKRDSVRITTHAEYPVGTIWITDIVHMPFGCSVWPAVWTKGPLWPDDGEIDIIEGINLMQDNQMALHTHPGCTHVSPAPADQRGASGQLDCSVDAGCTVRETAPNSFGENFNKAGGGVYATQFDSTGVFIWFWSRANIPKSITSSTSTSAMTQDDWGAPAASYPSGTSCDVSKFFGEQSLVIDITLCGNWAGDATIYNSQCSGQGTTGKCYEDNVIGPGTPKYDNAYFEFKYIRAYTNGTVASSNSSPTTTATGDRAASTSQGGGTSGAMPQLTSGLQKIYSSASLLLAGLFML